MNSNNQKELDSSLKLLAKSSLIVFIGVFLSKLFTYAYRIIIARHFGPEVYGLFSLALMMLGFFVAFSLIGLDSGLVRYIPFYRGKKQQNKIRYLFKFTFKTILSLSVLFGIILFLLSDIISINIFHNPDLSLFLKVFAPLIPISVISSYFLAAIIGYEKIGWYSFIHNISQNAGNVIFILLLIFLGLEVISVPFSYLLGILTVFILAYFVGKYHVPAIFEKSSIKEKEKNAIKREVLKYSTPLLFFSIIHIILYGIDSFFIGYFKGATEVGFYNAAVPIALILSIAPLLFIKLFFPMISREYGKKNLNLIKGLSKQIGKWIFFINLPIFILMMLFPGKIINILFGADYLIAGNALRFLAIGAFTFSIFRISDRLLSMAGKSKLLLLDVTIAAILNIVLNIILVPMPRIFSLDNSLGINGAAIATMSSIIVFSFLFLFQARHFLSITPLKRKMINIVLASIIPLILLIFLRKIIEINILSLIILFLFFLLLYTLLVFLVKGFDREDYMILSALKNKLPILKTNTTSKT